jgi:hypothetical protein
MLETNLHQLLSFKRVKVIVVVKTQGYISHGGQDSLVDKALDYRPKGTGFYPHLDHKGAQHERLINCPCEIIKIC